MLLPCCCRSASACAPGALNLPSPAGSPPPALGSFRPKEAGGICWVLWSKSQRLKPQQTWGSPAGSTQTPGYPRCWGPRHHHPSARPGRDGRVIVVEMAFSRPFCAAPPRAASQAAVLGRAPPPVGARRGPRGEALREAAGSRFSRLPASRRLEEDLLLSQGVTASREPPNL